MPELDFPQLDDHDPAVDKYIKQKHLSDIDDKLWKIQKSTRPTFGFLAPLHDKLRHRFAWYYKWHLNPGSNFLNSALVLTSVLAILAFSAYTLGIIGPAKKSSLAIAGIPKMINYQGKLADATDAPVPDGTYQMKITIWSDENTGSCLWAWKGSCGSVTNVPVVFANGIFSVLLGDTEFISSGYTNALNLDFNTDSYWLQAEVYNGATYETLLPRKRIGAVGYAYNSDTLDGIESTAFPLLAGRSGGQTLIGGTAASENLTLQSTSNSTRGLILVNDQMAFVGDNMILGNPPSSAGNGHFLMMTGGWAYQGGGSYNGGNLYLSGGYPGVGGGNFGNVIMAMTGPSGFPIGKVGIGTDTPDPLLSVAGTIGFIETGSTPTYYTIFQGGDQSADLTYTWPVDYGSNTNILKSDGAGIFSWTAQSANYWTLSGSNIYNNNTANVGIGTTGPDRKLDVLSASAPQLRLTYSDSTYYTDIRTNSAGKLEISPSGGQIDINPLGGSYPGSYYPFDLYGTPTNSSGDANQGAVLRVVNSYNAWDSTPKSAFVFSVKTQSTGNEYTPIAGIQGVGTTTVEGTPSGYLSLLAYESTTAHALKEVLQVKSDYNSSLSLYYGNMSTTSGKLSIGAKGNGVNNFAYSPLDIYGAVPPYSPNGGLLELLNNGTQVGGSIAKCGIVFSGIYDSSSLAYAQFANIIGAKENNGYGTLAGYFSISTNTSSNVMTEAIRVASYQYVGINTATPDRRLDILDASNPQLRLSHTDNTYYADLQTTSTGILNIQSSNRDVAVFGDVATATTGTQPVFNLNREITGYVSYPQAFALAIGRYTSPVAYEPDTRLDFNLKTYSTNDFYADATVMTLQSNGFVGIGTTSINEAMTVNGRLSLQETTAPSATSGFGKLYIKSSDSRIYYMDGAGREYDLIAGTTLYWTQSTGYLYPEIITDNLGMGTSSPARRIESLDVSNPQMRLTQTDATNYTDFQTTSSGYLNIKASNNYIGIDNASPTSTLDINGLTKATGLYATGLDTTPNTGLAIVGPYDTVGVGGGNWGFYPAGTTSHEYLFRGHQYRMRQNGTISQIQMYVADMTAVTSVSVRIWRFNGSTYDLVGETGDIHSSLTAGITNTVTLSSPITGVQEGDYYGYRITWNDGYGHPFAYAKTGLTGMRPFVYPNQSPAGNGFAWNSVPEYYDTNAVPILMYMTPPSFIALGDSIFQSWPEHRAFTSGDDDITNIPIQWEYILGHNFGMTYQNLGHGGDTTTQLVARLTTDMVNMYPKYAILGGGINDITQSFSKSTFVSNWTTMLSTARSNGIKPIVLLMTPWGAGTTLQNQTRDDWNLTLTALAKSYGAILVDTDTPIGQFRSGGDPGNLWDLQAAYDAGDHIHLSIAGYAKLAQAVIYAVAKNSSVTVGSTNINSSLNINGSIAETVTPENANFNADSSGYYYTCTTGAGGITATLPTIASSVGRTYSFTKVDNGAGALTIDGNGSETINGNATVSVATQWEGATLYNDGSQWIASLSGSNFWTRGSGKTYPTTIADLVGIGNNNPSYRLDVADSGAITADNRTLNVANTQTSSTTNVDIYGGYFLASGANSGTTATSTGVYASATGASTTNYGLYATASNAVGTNWAGYFAGNVGLSASSYLNFGTTGGSGGYGVRDNGGIIEFNNSGGSWTALSNYWNQSAGVVSPATATDSVNIATGESYMVNAVDTFTYDVAQNGVYLGQGYNAQSSITGDNNIIAGYNAGTSLTSGAYNIIMGYQAGDAITSASNNVLIGYQAGTSLTATTGSDSNVMIGNQSGFSAGASANSNTFYGIQSGYGMTGNSNVALGYETGYGASSTSNNMFIGYQAGYNTTGTGNMFIGYQTAYTNTVSGGYNILLGYQAGQSAATTLADAILIGYQAGYSSGGDVYPISIGYQAGYNNTGANNVNIGFGAGQYGSTANNNIAVGALAGNHNQTGINNVFLGYGAGDGLANNGGSSNVTIGFGAGLSMYLSGVDYANNNTFVGFGTGYSTQYGDNNVYMGFDSGYYNVTGSSNINIGYYAGAQSGATASTYNVLLGYQAGQNTNSIGNVYLGYNTGNFTTTGSYNIALGYSAGPGSGSGALASTIALGNYAIPSASNQFVLGGGDATGYGSITDAYLGQGVTAAAPAGITLHATNTTTVNGAGAPITIAGGKGNGSGVGGTIYFKTTPASSSTLTDYMHISSTELVVNEASYAFNLRVESDNQTNMFYIDGTNDRIGIKNGSPSYTIDIADSGVVTSANRTLNIANTQTSVSSISLYGAYLSVTGSNTGTGSNLGLYTTAANAALNNYGIYASAAGGTTAYGIYATATGGSTNYAGYFDGSVRANALNINGAYNLPTSDGTSGYVLSTNGSGTVSWASGGYWTRNAGSGYTYLTNSGDKVGIGTSTPTEALQVAGNIVIGYGANDNHSNSLKLQHIRGATGILQDNDEMGAVTFWGYDGTSPFDNAHYLKSALILGVVDGTPGTGDMPGSLQFYTRAAGDSDVTKRMTIGNTGKVAINSTTNPAEALKVQGFTTGGTDYAIYGYGDEIGVGGSGSVYGVVGYSPNGSGIRGSSDAGNGYGVHGYCEGANCIAVYGLTAGTGTTYAGYFGGNVYITGNGYLGGTAQGNWDLAEMTPVLTSETLPEPGSVVSFYAGNTEKVTLTSNANDNLVAGIVSTNPSTVMGVRAEDGTWQKARDNQHEIPLTLSGRVPVKISGENGPIKVGDKLTSAVTSGYAAKATKPGMVIGVAMEDFSGDKGTITVSANLFYYNPSTEEGVQGSTTITTENINSPDTKDLVLYPGSGKLKVLGNLVVGGNIVADSLTVTQSIATNNLIVMDKLITQDLTIKGHIIGSHDTNGTLTIKSGETTGEFVFDTPYLSEPTITLAKKTTCKDELQSDGTTKHICPIFSGNVAVEVYNDHFVVHLPSTQSDDIQVNWQIR